MTDSRVLPADVYDTLELSALAFGGIGARRAFEGCRSIGLESKTAVPVCLLGHWQFATDGGCGWWLPQVTAPENDEAVVAINARKGVLCDSRVSWEEYTRELNIVRGD